MLCCVFRVWSAFIYRRCILLDNGDQLVCLSIGPLFSCVICTWRVVKIMEGGDFSLYY